MQPPLPPLPAAMTDDDLLHLWPCSLGCGSIEQVTLAQMYVGESTGVPSSKAAMPH